VEGGLLWLPRGQIEWAGLLSFLFTFCFPSVLFFCLAETFGDKREKEEFQKVTKQV
jgi:predicted permease